MPSLHWELNSTAMTTAILKIQLSEWFVQEIRLGKV